jgi:DNA-binding MarR family transcriptional regulator/GNAT superfamily N-acetyltransferase
MSIMVPPSLQADIAAFRRFNRMYTKFLGTLNEGLLESQFSLAEARVLYELAHRPAPTAKDLIAELGLDPGYLSRILGTFERKALLKREPSPQDARYANLTLTARGKAAFTKLNTLSENQATEVFQPLPAPTRRELIRCMTTIEQTLSPPAPTQTHYILRPHRVGDMGWVVQSEALGYALQFNWDNTFEALVAKIVADFITNFTPAREHCWIAEIAALPVGHIFLVQHPSDPSAAKLRLLFVDPSARGLGLGDALVHECLRFARSAGYRKVVLWTQSILTAAHHIYAKAGFHLVKEEPHHSFGHALIGQEWELDLTYGSV